MSDTTNFDDTNQWWTTVIICLTLMGLVLLASSSASTEYYLDNPIPESPIITLIFAVVAIMVLYSWWHGDMPLGKDTIKKKETEK